MLGQVKVTRNWARFGGWPQTGAPKQLENETRAWECRNTYLQTQFGLWSYGGQVAYVNQEGLVTSSFNGCPVGAPEWALTDLGRMIQAVP